MLVQQIGLYGPSGPVQPNWFPAADKVAHALGFALPMFLLLTTEQNSPSGAGRALRPGWVVVPAVLFAINAVVSEVVQARAGSGRSGDVLDTVADLVGIVVGWLAYRWCRDRLPGGRRRHVRADA